jgi:hypothetical protein
LYFEDAPKRDISGGWIEQVGGNTYSANVNSFDLYTASYNNPALLSALNSHGGVQFYIEGRNQITTITGIQFGIYQFGNTQQTRVFFSPNIDMTPFCGTNFYYL